jgi:hypothetical protein
MTGEAIVGGAIRAEILRRLRAAEVEHGVRIQKRGSGLLSAQKIWKFKRSSLEPYRPSLKHRAGFRTLIHAESLTRKKHADSMQQVRAGDITSSIGR